MLSIAKKGIASVYNLLSPKKKTMAALQEMDKHAARLASFKMKGTAGKKRASNAKGKQTGKWPHQTPTAEQVMLRTLARSKLLTILARECRLLLRTLELGAGPGPMLHVQQFSRRMGTQ